MEGRWVVVPAGLGGMTEWHAVASVPDEGAGSPGLLECGMGFLRDGTIAHTARGRVPEEFRFVARCAGCVAKRGE